MAKNPNIKRANHVQEYTFDQIQELKRCMNDPIHFIENYVKIVHPMQGTVLFKLYPYQKKMVQAFYDERYTIVLSARQTGKEQPHSAKIAIPSGWTTMGEIKTGDTVLTPDGGKAKVLQKFPQGIKDVYRITFNDGSHAECGLEHLWNVYIDDKSKIIPLIDIIPLLNDKEIQIPIVTSVNFNERDLPNDPYEYGYRHGLHNVKIPDEYLIASHSQRLALLQGLLDSNSMKGYEEDTQSYFAIFRTTSLDVCKNINQLVRGLGGLSTHYKLKDSDSQYHVHIRFSDLSQCFRKAFKRNFCFEITTNHDKLFRTIINITKVRQEESSCILIDHPDHLYITDNYTVTHNSAVSSAFLLWYATFNFDKTILIASRSNDHAKEMIQRIRFAYENLPFWVKSGVNDDGWNKHSIGFDNGCRILSAATSENAGRGFSISLLYLDEFAFVAPNIQEEFWSSISPTLATGGGCIMTSTPNGDMDLFAQMWRSANIPNSDPTSKAGINGYLPIEVKWNEPPGRDAKFKEEQIAKLGERKWNQEYACCDYYTKVDIIDENNIMRTINIGDLYGMFE